MTRSDAGPQGIAPALARSWTRLYTFGLPAATRARRRQQIESDLYEHWNDVRSGSGPSLRFSVHALDRTLRGALADILWRFQLEGPQMQLHVPIDRLAGLLLILMVGAIALSMSASGYDTAHDGFESELGRLAEVTGWQAALYTTLQVLAAAGMVAAAIVFYLQLRGPTLTLSLITAAGLSLAGVLTVVGSSLYASAAAIADQWAADPTAEEAAMVTSRALLIALGTLTPVILVALVVGLEALAVACARLRIVPPVLGYLAGLAAGILALSLPLGLASDGFAWILPGITVLLLMVWLLTTGSMLLFGGATSRPSPPPAAAVPGPPG